MNPHLKHTLSKDSYRVTLCQAHGGITWRVDIYVNTFRVYNNAKIQLLDTNPRNPNPVRLETRTVDMNKIRALCESTKRHDELTIEAAAFGRDSSEHERSFKFTLVANEKDGECPQDCLLILVTSDTHRPIRLNIHKAWFNA